MAAVTPRCLRLLNAGFAIELPIVDAADEGIPLCWREVQDSPFRVLAVANPDPVVGQACDLPLRKAPNGERRCDNIASPKRWTRKASPVTASYDTWGSTRCLPLFPLIWQVQIIGTSRPDAVACPRDGRDHRIPQVGGRQ